MIKNLYNKPFYYIVALFIGGITPFCVSLTQAQAHQEQYINTSTVDKEAMRAHQLMVGEGVKIDQQKAISLIQISYENGSPYGKYMYTRYLMGKKDPERVKKNIADALTQIMPSAQHGDPFAQYTVGVIHHIGLGVQPNMQKAAEWYKKAVENNVPSAMNNLASLYMRGEGIEKDTEKAVQLMMRAASHDMAAAYSNLAFLYTGFSKDTPYKRDFHKVNYWAERGAELGDQRAAELYEFSQRDLSKPDFDLTMPGYDKHGFTLNSEDAAREESQRDRKPLLELSYIDQSLSRINNLLFLSPRDRNKDHDQLLIKINDSGHWKVKIVKDKDIYWEKQGQGHARLVWSGEISEEIEKVKNPHFLGRSLCILDSARFCVKDGWYQVVLESNAKDKYNSTFAIDNTPPIITKTGYKVIKNTGSSIQTEINFVAFDAVVQTRYKPQTGTSTGDVKLTQIESNQKIVSQNVFEKTIFSHHVLEIKVVVEGSWDQTSLELSLADKIGNEATYRVSGCDSGRCFPGSPVLDENGFWLE
jgi:hypothetical protein